MPHYLIGSRETVVRQNWIKSRIERAHIEDTIIEDPPSPQSMVHGLDWAIVNQEVMRPDIRILRKVVEAPRHECQRTRVGKFVENELENFVCDGCENGLAWKA